MDRRKAQELVKDLASDPDAEFAQVIELDASEMTPMVATPGDPGNGKYVRDLNTPVPIEIAYGGTCTAGKNEDMDMYARVLADALKQGGPGATTSPTQVVISAQNRNFPGRSGPGQMYLASPYTVAASAVAGYIVEYQPLEQLVSA